MSFRIRIPGRGDRFCSRAFLIMYVRPKADTEQPNAEYVRASGKCTECHVRIQYSIVHEYETSLR